MLINCSFTSLTFPRALKRAEVFPHPKDGDHEVPDNNRPISLLPVLSKVTGKNALRQCNDYLTRNNRLTQHQSGNRTFHSTESLSLLVTDDIFKTIDQKKLIAMVSNTDLEKRCLILLILHKVPNSVDTNDAVCSLNDKLESNSMPKSVT